VSGFDLDLFVIGGGSGGVRAARLAAEAGAKVALAEADRMGGTCVIRGCVPKKLMVYAADFGEAIADARAFGWDTGDTEFDWPRFRAAKDTEIARLEAAYRARLLKAGVTIHDTRAVLEGPHQVRLATGGLLVAKHILIATGGHPARPEVPGAELALVSDDIFRLDRLPGSVIILGGGYIACEFASILKGMGVDVTLAFRAREVLRGFDADLAAVVGAGLRSRGIRIMAGAADFAITGSGGTRRVSFADGRSATGEAVLMALGRAANGRGLGLEAAGVALRPDGTVPVDRWSQTNVPSVFAIGDVTGRQALTPLAIRQGAAFAATLFGGVRTSAEDGPVPTAVFTRPEAATVGLTEAEAGARGGVRIFRSDFKPMAQGFAGREERMMMKLVVEAASDRVLGCHIAGPGAAEIVQMAAIALTLGATKADFDRTVALHPSAAEELVTMKTPTET
jgi:glutathione reductase (NADPH)